MRKLNTIMSNDLSTSLLLGISACISYIVHKWWLKGRDNRNEFTNFKTNYGSIRDLIFIILLAVGSIFFFIKSIL